jgi:ABC-type antimicrobial peptide transport system permease subunit
VDRQPRRFNTVLLTLFGGVALGLAAIGLYGVLSCSVAQRTREIGVRVALGAGRRQVVALVLRQAAVLVTAGIVIGMAAAVAGAQYMQGMLYGIGPRDPATLAWVTGVLVTIGLLASAVPARQAAAANPLDALRAE